MENRGDYDEARNTADPKSAISVSVKNNLKDLASFLESMGRYRLNGRTATYLKKRV